MKHGLIFFLLLLSMSFPVWSQIDHDSCTIEFRNGGSARGVVKNSEWIISPEKIKFKAAGDNEFKEYGPMEILSFQMNQEFYLGAEVDVNDAGMDPEDLTEDTSIHLRHEYRFLKRIGEGPLELYALLLHHNIYNFYVGSPGRGPLLLKCKRFLDNSSNVQDKNYIVPEQNYYERSIFRTQLEELLPDDPMIHRKINHTEYSLYSMISLWNAYQKKIEPNWKARHVGKRITGGIYFGSGVSRPNYSHFEYDPLLYFGTRFNPHLYTQVSGNLLIGIGGRAGRIGRHALVFHGDLRRVTSSGTDAVTNFNSFVNYPFTIQLRTTLIRGGINYQYICYKGKKALLHVFAGGFVGYHIQNDNVAKQINGSYEYHNLEFTFGEGVMGGLGWRFNHLNIAFTMDTYNVKNTVWVPLMNFKSAGIQVGYIF